MRPLEFPKGVPFKKTFAFEVPGDSVPYTRMTRGGLKLLKMPDHKLDKTGLDKKRKIQRYLDYKNLVEMISLQAKFDRAPKEKVYLNCMIYFKNYAHADPENVRKGIQDALFDNDKYVAGAYDFDYDPQNPRVEVTICQP